MKKGLDVTLMSSVLSRGAAMMRPDGGFGAFVSSYAFDVAVISNKQNVVSC